MWVSCRSLYELQLPYKKVTEGPNIGQVKEESSLNRRIRKTNNIEGVVGFRVRFIIREN